MDKTALVDRDIEAGRRLVQALDHAGFPVTAALWNFLPEEGTWRLLIASPQVGKRGPRATYAAIQEVSINAGIELPLYRVSAVSADEPLITELRFFAGTDPAPFIGGTHLQSAVIGDVFIDEAYVYRADRMIGKTGTFELWSVAPAKPRKVWTARRCKVTVENGLFKRIEVQGYDWPQSHARNGVNAHLGVLANPETRDGETFGDVQRWSILAGRLRSVETVARDVRIEGYVETPSAAGAAT